MNALRLIVVHLHLISYLKPHYKNSGLGLGLGLSTIMFMWVHTSFKYWKISSKNVVTVAQIYRQQVHFPVSECSSIYAPWKWLPVVKKMYSGKKNYNK